MNKTLSLGQMLREFKTANTLLKKKSKGRMSLECMEVFFYMSENKRVEMREIQRAMGYAQAKTHRTVKHLKDLGWLSVSLSDGDGRQRTVELTSDGSDFHDYIQYKAQQQQSEGLTQYG